MPDYPSLYDVAAGRSHRWGAGRSVSVGADSDGSIRFDGGDAEERLFRLEFSARRWFLEPEPRISVTVNQAKIRDRVQLEHLSVIQWGERTVLFLERDDPTVSTRYSANLWLVNRLDASRAVSTDADLVKTAELLETIQIPAHRPSAASAPPKLPGAIELPERELVIGRHRFRVDILLPDVRVSGVHARIHRQGNRVELSDLNSTNGTFVDGDRIASPRVVQRGSRIEIGPYTLVLGSKALYPLSHDNDVELAARGLVRRIPNRRNRGQEKVILDEISLVVRPREFVCILGPSGSGKTTLLSALSARAPADEGQVLLNGENLYTRFEALKQNLAVVPQNDVLHDVLPLNIALWYTAKLRLPADMTGRDIESRVDATLDTVSLVQRQYTPIRQLSGGQIKRASWANESICNPSLIFLDEVTSGLDEQTDSEMMRLFRQMADDGKTIICVTHSLSYVEQNCHLLVVLAPGGVLAFVGPPAAALEYFQVPRLGDVYQRLREKLPEQWKLQFRQSGLYREYVEQRLPPIGQVAKTGHVSKSWDSSGFLTAWRQLVILIRRYAAVQWADKRAIAMMLGQSLFVAGLLSWLFGDISALDATAEASRLAELSAPGLSWDELFPEHQQEFLAEAEEAKKTDRSSKLLFLLCISCIWFGCNNAAKEIIKERTIYNKERDVGVKIPSYYGSKLTLLGILSVVQSSILYGLVDHFTRLGGDFSHQWFLLSFSVVTGVALGLAISAVATSEDVAVTIVPMALIPQIILAGLIAPLMNHTRLFSQICVPAYWSYQGLLHSLEPAIRERLREDNYLSLAPHWNLAMISGVLAVYVVVFAATSLVALYWRD